MADVTTRTERRGRASAGIWRVVAEVAVISAVVGIVMGLLWWLLAPDVVGVVSSGDLFLGSDNASRMFDRDAMFALLGAGCGLVLAAVFVVRHAQFPVTTLVSLVVAGVGGSLVARFVGGIAAPDPRLGGVADGAERAFGLELDTTSALFVWPLVATVVVAVVAVFREDHTPWSMAGGVGNDPERAAVSQSDRSSRSWPR